jgi:hypothetical protein
MAITKHLFANYVQKLPDGEFDFSSSDIRYGLFTSAWTPDYVNPTLYDDVFMFECADEGFSGGYTSYGRPLFAEISSGGSADTVMVTGGPCVWEVLTATFRYLIFWVAGQNMLIGALDFGEDQVYEAQEFNLELPDGVLTFSAGQ